MLVKIIIVRLQPCGLYKHTILWFTQDVPQPYLRILGRLDGLGCAVSDVHTGKFAAIVIRHSFRSAFQSSCRGAWFNYRY